MISAQDKAELARQDEFVRPAPATAEARHQATVDRLLEAVAFLRNMRRLQDDVNEGKAELISALQEANQTLRVRNAQLEAQMARLNAQAAPPAERMKAAEHNAFPGGRWGGMTNQ